MIRRVCLWACALSLFAVAVSQSDGQTLGLERGELRHHPYGQGYYGGYGRGYYAGHGPRYHAYTPRGHAYSPYGKGPYMYGGPHVRPVTNRVNVYHGHSTAGYTGYYRQHYGPVYSPFGLGVYDTYGW
jgi:hypothetical protein